MLMVLGAIWALGLAYFYAQTRIEGTAPTETLDGIVVLTGGAGRIQAGFDLLEKKHANLMLISGVNPVVTTLDLAKLSGAEAKLISCCVETGTEAGDTIGNADEAAEWTNRRKIDSFYLVTASYHVPRAMLLFKARIPYANIQPYPVKADISTQYFIKEYHKYLVTLFTNI